jgi:16S rRNA (cytosine1402-N4)-methyltransferase
MRHEPVLVNEVMDALDLKPGKKIIDCTLGDAGHSEKILEKIAPTGVLLGIDMDPEAILRAKQFLYRFDQRAVCVRENFEHLTTIVEEKKFGPVDGILMDFGWSTPQFEDRFRGFSFQNPEEPLDMRYGAGLQKTETAVGILNTRRSEELEKIFHEYSEESLSREIAEAIIERRKEKLFEKVGDLVEVVLETYRKKLKTDKEIPWIGGLHPATKVFQALRIAVNDELGVIERVLPQAIEVLARGGRLAVITFHSLEDRIVKHYFKKLVIQEHVVSITKKPVVCSPEEAERNSRARSAKLRVVQKI